MRNSDKPFPFFRGKIFLFQPEEHKVSVDLVIFLSKIRGIKRSSKVADLGAGFGFLSISLAKKYKVKIFAIEIEKNMLSLLKKNVEINNLQNYVEVFEADIRAIEKHFKRGMFDVVVSNPPFFPINYSENVNPYHFEVLGKLEDFVKAASYLLRDGGYFNILIPSFRLYELFTLESKYNLPPRFMSVIFPTVKKPAKLCVVTSIKNVSGPLNFDKPVIINTEDGEYTEEVRRILESYL